MPYVRSTRFPELFKKDGSTVWWTYLPNPDGGRQLRESTGHRDERAAHGWYLERVRLPSRAEQAPHQKERRLEDALVARIEWLKAARKNDDKTRKKLSESTIDFYRKKGKPLVRLLGPDTLLSAIGHEEIRRYIVQRSAETSKATTIGKELTALSMAMRLARKDGVACSPFADIKPEDFAAVYVPKERWLTEAEVDALVFDVLSPKRGAVAAFIVATSATYPSEVDPVKRAMVNEKTYEVHLPGTKREARDRKLRVPSHARKYLDYALTHASGGPGGALFEPWTNVRRDLHVAAGLLSMCAPCRAAHVAWARHVRGATKAALVDDCRRCKAAAKFEALSPNDLRRTFVQWLVRSGVPYELVYPMTGHNSPRMLQMVYGKRDATAVSELVEIALKKAPKTARRKTG